ncbi:SinR-like protein [Pseudomonas aeruginosa NCGM2.S1]|nr:SinR-like protein [Pseudomonas aeruginosa NCGM2.S1]
MDADDGLLVTRLQGDAAWFGLDAEKTQWLQNQYQRCEA